jgi:type I restriction enzyme S subunit
MSKKKEPQRMKHEIHENKSKGLVPGLRFPEFRDAGEWEDKELGKLSSFFKGKGLSKKDIVYGGKNQCVHYGELFTKYSDIIRRLSEKCKN